MRKIRKKRKPIPGIFLLPLMMTRIVLDYPQITGEEYLGILEGENAVQVEGIEDGDLYWKNVKADEEVEKVRSEILEGNGVNSRGLMKINIKSIKSALDRLKNLAYNQK